MTFYVRIRFPDTTVTWELQSHNQTTALYAATELSKPDGQVVSWYRQKPPQW